MSLPWERIVCIAWDFGGTLAAPGPSPDGAVVADVLAGVFGAAAPRGFATVFDEFAARARHHARRTGRQPSWTGVLRDAAAVVGLSVPDGHAVEDAVFDYVPDATVDPRAVAGVWRLHELGFRCVLACNTQRPGPRRHRTLVDAGIAGCFSAVLCSSTLGIRKPHPDFYAAVWRAAGCAPDQVVFVGDTPGKDVAGPRQAGAHAVLVAGTPADAGGEVVVVGHVAELAGLVEAHRGR
ncbi:MAG: HAD family hydrolase [Pseudonocardiaceae bacterium]